MILSVIIVLNKMVILKMALKTVRLVAMYAKPKRNSSHHGSRSPFTGLLSGTTSSSKAAMKNPPATTKGTLPKPLSWMIGSPMAKPNPSATIMVVTNNELAQSKSFFFTRRGMAAASAGAKNWLPIEIKNARVNAATGDVLMIGRAIMATKAERARFEQTRTALLDQRST